MATLTKQRAHKPLGKGTLSYSNARMDKIEEFRITLPSSKGETRLITLAMDRLEAEYTAGVLARFLVTDMNTPFYERHKLSGPEALRMLADKLQEEQ